MKLTDLGRTFLIELLPGMQKALYSVPRTGKADVQKTRYLKHKI